MNHNKQEWKRVIFPIYKCSGRITREYRTETWDNKWKRSDINFVFNLIEYKTKHFALIRCVYKCKIVLIFLPFLFILISLIEFFHYSDISLGITLAIISVLLGMISWFIINVMQRLVYKSQARKVYKILSEVNENWFNPDAWCLMLNPDFSSLSVYTIPKYVQWSKTINNYLTAENCSTLQFKESFFGNKNRTLYILNSINKMKNQNKNKNNEKKDIKGVIPVKRSNDYRSYNLENQKYMSFMKHFKT